jgi:hypothetical protein
MISLPMHMAHSFGLLAVPLLCLAWPIYQDASATPPASGEIELRLELRRGGQWQSVDVHTVVRTKDEIRFRFKTSFPGYLKVVNQSSEGQTSSLFPFGDAKQSSQVEANLDYAIPNANGSFAVGGKPGFDLTEWVVSSVPLEGDWQPTSFSSEPSTLLPKCQDGDLKGRRSCLDNRAGPAAISSSKEQNLRAAPDAPLISRDLNFRSRDLSALISVPDISRKIVVYEFRVAHR